jgi:outer membrane protein assembly factor BamE
MRLILIAIITAITLSGCGFVGFPGVYRIGIEQGNVVTQEMVDQLKPGMTRRQVRFVLGTPLVEDSFNEDRWDYRYVFSRGDIQILDNRLTVYFEADVLSRFDSKIPPSSEAEDNKEATAEETN